MVHASADKAFPEHSIGHNPFFGEALRAQVGPALNPGMMLHNPCIIK